MYELKEICGVKYSLPNECLIDFYFPVRDKKETPLYVYFHGGGLENGLRREEYLGELAQKYGIAVASADYRMYKSAKFPDFIKDAASAVAYVVKNCANEYKSLIVGGSSAGAYLSMMLFFDPRYLAEHGLTYENVDGFIFDAGQPTAHFNVLREMGIDSRAIRVDETAPIYFVDKNVDFPFKIPPMLVINAEHDMDNRVEQTKLLLGVMRTFGYDMSKVYYKLIEDSLHCEYCKKRNSEGEFIINPILAEFIDSI